MLIVTVCQVTRCKGALPIQASWFSDRYSPDEWDDTLRQFTSLVGGKVVVLRGPQFRVRSKDDIVDDYNTWVWCGTNPGGVGPVGGCLEAIEKRAKSKGLRVGAWMTYDYQYNYSPEAMVRCPELDGMTNSSRIYYHVVVPLSTTVFLNESDPCSFAPGSDVGVVLTSFAGTDPLEILLEKATKRDVGVFVGLPMNWSPWNDTVVPSYLDLIQRIIVDHRIRFSGSLNSTLLGYYSTDETFIGAPYINLLSLYKSIGTMIKAVGKKFLLSPYIDVNYSQLNSSVDAHVKGMQTILDLKIADIVAVQEGRGTSKGSYYWQHEIDLSIQQVDPTLLRIVQYLDPAVPSNQTYRKQYAASNRQLFEAFAKQIDEWNEVEVDYPVALWLNVEAFEYLRDYPCLPVDRDGSGMAELLDRTSKQRIDRAFAVQAAFVSGVISFAWDSDYLCVPAGSSYDRSLSDNIFDDGWRPVTSLIYQDPSNTSRLIAVGLNLEYAASYFITYRDVSGKVYNLTDVRPVSFDPSWGQEHNRLSELQASTLPFSFWDELDSQYPYLGIVPDNSYWPCFLN